MAPAPTDKDIYIKRFSELGKGAPLYQPCEVQLGDVGFIDPHDGFFQKLYNIAKPPTKYNGCPPPIKFQKVRHTEQWDAIHMKKSKGSGASSQTNIKGGEIQFAFSEVKHGECILIPGSIVVMERMENTGNLPEYMHHYLYWIGRTFIGGEGYKFTPESLILVVRTVKTDRWAIAVNTSREVVKDLSFNVASAVGATLWGQWSANSLISRSGPPPVAGELHRTDIEDANQTIFVRRIALRQPTSYFGRPEFRPSDNDMFPTGNYAFDMFNLFAARTKQDWWVVASEEREDTRSLSAAASGASVSADIEEVSETGSEDNSDEE